MGRRKSRGKTLKRAGNSDKRTALTSGRLGSRPTYCWCLSALNCKMGRGAPVCLPRLLAVRTVRQCLEKRVVAGKQGLRWLISWRGLTAHRALSWSEKRAAESLPSSPSQVSICSTRLLALRRHLGVMSELLWPRPRPSWQHPALPSSSSSSGCWLFFRRLAVRSLGSSSDPTEMGSLRQTTSLFWASVSSLVKLWG